MVLIKLLDIYFAETDSSEKESESSNIKNLNIDPKLNKPKSCTKNTNSRFICTSIGKIKINN